MKKLVNNQSSAMESGNHFKNGARLKGMMSKDNLIKIVAFFLILTGSAMPVNANDKPLGSGLYLLDEDVDANSSLLYVKITSSQYSELISKWDYSNALQSISNTIYEKLNDDFDFIFFVLDRDGNQYQTGYSLDFEGVNNLISNNIQGLGKSMFSDATSWGSNGNLKSAIYLPSYDAILTGPALHELGHSWGANICMTYDQDGSLYDLHWGVSNAGGQLGGFRYVRTVEENSGGIQGKTKYQASFSSPEVNTDGSFKYGGFGINANGGNSVPYSDIELYLMGMKSAQDLRNSNFRLDIYSGNSSDDSFNSGYFYSTNVTSYTIDDIIALNGNRVPDSNTSQKRFKILTVVLSVNGNSDNRFEEIIDHIRWFAAPVSDNTYNWVVNFSQATQGTGSLEVNGIKNSLKENIIVEEFEIVNGTLTGYYGAGGNVIIPDGVHTIGAQSFASNHSIISVTIPEGVAVIQLAAFQECINMSAISFPNSLEIIYEWSFHGCNSLTEITIPEKVHHIGANPFQSCQNLTTIHVNVNNKHYISENGVLFNKDKTYLITYPGGKQGKYDIPEGVINIRKAFFGCKGVTSVTFPSTLHIISESSFYECTGLNELTIPNTVKSWGTGVFYGCTSLTHVTVPGHMRYDDNDGIPVEFSESTLGFVTFYNCIGLKSVIIEEGITDLGGMVFDGCSNLAEVSLPNSLTNLGWQSFMRCVNLKTIDIPGKVTEISIYCFAYSGLTSVVIPESITFMDRGVFAYCDDLKEVEVKWKQPMTNLSNGIYGDEPVFTNEWEKTLYVPEGTKSLYENAAPWRYFGTIMEKPATSVPNIIKETDVYASNNILYINLSKHETIYIYSITGKLLFERSIQEGNHQIYLGAMNDKIVIIKGSSGWAKKIIL